MFAVLVGLLKSRAGAVGGDAFTAQLDRHLVGLRIGAFHAALRVSLVQADVVDHLALLVVEAAQEGAGAEQTSKTAVGKGRKSVCK